MSLKGVELSFIWKWEGCRSKDRPGNIVTVGMEKHLTVSATQSRFTRCKKFHD